MGDKTNNDNIIQKLQDEQARNRAELDNLRATLQGYQIKVENQARELAEKDEDLEAMASQVLYWRTRVKHWMTKAGYGV